MGGYLKTMPKYATDIMRQTASGKLRLELQHSGFSPLDKQIEKGVNRLTVGMVIAASILAAALVLNSSQKVLEFTVDWWGRQTVSLTAVLGLSGYVIATILGIWLIISIFRSGRL